jgi:hypothetical protein
MAATATASELPLPSWLTVKEAATVANLSPGRIRQMIVDDTIKPRDRRRFGNQWQIRRSAAERIRDNVPSQGWPRGKARKSTDG